MSDERAVLRQLVDIARDPAVDPAKIDALYNIIERRERTQNERKCRQAMLTVQRELMPVLAEAEGERSKYVPLAVLSARIDPVLQRHGFVTSYGEAESTKENHYRIVMHVTHTPTGHTFSEWADIGMDVVGPKGGGTKSGAQGSGSVITYGRRYLKTMVWDVRVYNDTDGAMAKGDSIHADVAATLREALKVVGVPEDVFLQAFAIKSIEQLPASQLGAAMERIDTRRKMQDERQEQQDESGAAQT